MRRRHTVFDWDWSSDVSSSDLRLAMRTMPSSQGGFRFSGQPSTLLQGDLVDVAPPPILFRLERLDDRVLRLAEVFGGVFVLRIVAAADVPTREAQTQMHPLIAGLQTIFASVGARGYFADLGNVRAGHRSP